MPSILKKLDTITINGSNKYLGGYIYDLNFRPSIGDSPSSLTVSVVSEDGKYSKPIPSVLQPHMINIGGSNLKMYLIKYREKSSSQGKILEVEFIDASFNLDKIYVGLIKKHYNDPQPVKKQGRIISNFYKRFTIRNNFIILGRELHPCDKNKDGTLSPKEIRDLDPCDPCPTCPSDKFNKETKCDELSYQKIFDVAYHFYEFLDGLAAMNKFNVEKPKIPEEKIKTYLKDYVGTARSVLDAWCSDLALSYIFNAQDNTLFFKDLAKDTILNENAIRALITSSDAKIISEEKEVSMENTCSRGSISLYEREGAFKNYSCSKSQSLVLPMITDFDYLGMRERTVDSTTITSLQDTIGSILGNYSEALRELYWMRNVYNITDAKSARKMVEPLELGKGSEERISGFFETINKKMPEMGNMIIVGVIEDPSKVKGELKEEEKLINSQYNTLVNNIANDVDRNEFIKKDGFFIVAYSDKDFYEKRLEAEKKYFSALGRFYLREGYVRLCGATGSPEEVIKNTEITTADGQASFYTKGFELSSLPIAEYPYEQDGYVGCLLTSSNKKDLTINPPKSPFESFETKLLANPNQAKIYYGPTVLLLEREPVWSPDPNKLEAYQNVLLEYQKFFMKEYGSDGKGYIPTSAYPESIQEILKTSATKILSPQKETLPGNIRIYSFLPNKFKVTTSFTQHPTEKLGKELKENKQRSDPTAIPGLLNKECFKISIDGGLDIYAPPLSVQKDIKEGNKDTDSPCDDFIKDRKAAYRIIVNQNFNQFKEIGKIQNIQENLTKNILDRNTLKFELNYLNISDSDFEVLNNTCQPDPKILMQIHEKFNIGFTKDITTPMTKIKYQLKGIPIKSFKDAIELGLDEINFTYSSDGGVCTISFSNDFQKNRSIDAVKAGLAYNKTQYSSYSPSRDTAI